VWQKSHKLVLEIYRVTTGFPKEEMYGLQSQMRRAGSSIPGNIAEGCAKNSNKEFSRFLQISLGSANELDYFLLLSRDLGYMTPSSYKKLYNDLVEIKKMLTSFIVKLRKMEDKSKRKR